MKISVNENNIKYIISNGDEHRINLGFSDIHNHGFQVVDHIIDKLHKEMVDRKVKEGEEVMVYGDNIEAKMIARKLEDKIKREVNINPINLEEDNLI